MFKKRVVILGAGISGLSLAWQLCQDKDCEVIVLEKENRSGGWIRSEKKEGFFFERGPHTFSASRSSSLLQLAKQVGMEEEILYSDQAASKRFIYHEGRLKTLPKWFLIKALFRDLRMPSNEEEESIYAFAVRRFGETAADLLFDPLTIGIYAGNMHQLSMQACFPFFKQLEKKYGSITKGLLAHYFRKQNISSGLFTFKKGIESLVQTITNQLTGKILFNEEATALRFTPSYVEIETKTQIWQANHVFCALPAHAAQTLLSPHDSELGRLLTIPMSQVSVVNLGYRKESIPYKGFGYLVPTKEKQDIFGVIFDSLIFPQQNSTSEELRLSVLMRQNSQSEAIAQQTLAKHLGIVSKPDLILAMQAEIPQYTLKHQERIAALKMLMHKKFPRCTLLGNYLEGVSVNDCIFQGICHD